MTTITGNSYLDTLTTKTSATGTKAKGSNTMDQSSFLKLMTTQLQTQDPTAPTDNNQMVAQMAQFSQVAGIAEMNQSLKNIVTGMQSQQMGDAASWIGRAALVPSDRISALPNGSYEGQITLPDDATALSIDLVDGNGTIVHSEDLGKQAAGTVAYGWDGKDAAGRTVATTGALTVKVTARGKEGALAATPAAWTTVTGVQSPRRRLVRPPRHRAGADRSRRHPQPFLIPAS
ncbi:MAG: flagellar hook capping protein [Sphingomonas fennica]